MCCAFFVSATNGDLSPSETAVSHIHEDHTVTHSQSDKKERTESVWLNVQSLLFETRGTRKKGITGREHGLLTSGHAMQVVGMIEVMSTEWMRY